VRLLSAGAFGDAIGNGIFSDMMARLKMNAVGFPPPIDESALEP